MNHHLSGIEQYEKLLPVSKMLYDYTSGLTWQMLLPFFLLSIAITYSTDLGITGSVIIRLKRLFLVALLLVAFPMLAEFMQSLGVEIAKGIDDMTGIDMVLDAASKRAEMYSFDLNGILNLGGDLLLGVLSLASFLILVFARYFLLAFQHFYWLLMIVLAPFMILAFLFESSSGVTKNLFKNLIQISCWPVIWSIMSAFLKAMPFASIYATDGGLLTIVTLNLIVAIALLFSPFIVSQLCDGVSLSVGDTLRRGALKAVAVANPKVAAVYSKIQTTERLAKISNNISKKDK